MSSEVLGIQLNVIVGAIAGSPARSFDLINRDVAEANRSFAVHGIQVDVAKLSVGGPTLHTPHTVETFKSERDALRSGDHLNVAYLKGPIYRAVSWRWRVQSVRVSASSGPAQATLWNNIDSTGSSLVVNGSMAVIPASHRNGVMSITVPDSGSVTVFSEQDFGGQARTFRCSVSDLGTRFGYFDWWASTVRATGNRRSWDAFDIWLQPSGGRHALTWGIGQALGVSAGASVSEDAAARARRHILDNSGVRRTIRIGAER